MSEEQEITMIWDSIPQIHDPIKEITPLWKINYYDGRTLEAIGVYDGKKVYIRSEDEQRLRTYPVIYTDGDDLCREHSYIRINSYHVTEIEDHEFNILLRGYEASGRPNEYQEGYNLFSHTDSEPTQDIDAGFDFKKQEKEEKEVYDWLKNNRKPLGWFVYF